MKRLFGTLAITAITAVALGAAGAQAENAASESRAELDRLWNQETVTERAPTAASVQVNFAGGADRRDTSQHLAGPWADNFRGGRTHPPAGR